MFKLLKERRKGRLLVKLAGLKAERREEERIELATGTVYPTIRAETAKRIAELEEALRQLEA